MPLNLLFYGKFSGFRSLCFSAFSTLPNGDYGEHWDFLKGVRGTFRGLMGGLPAYVRYLWKLCYLFYRTTGIQKQNELSY